MVFLKLAFVPNKLYCLVINMSLFLFFQGLGYAIAKRVAMMGATVILACRSEEKARNVSG